MYHYDVLDDIYSILQTDKSIFIKFAAKRWRRVQKLLQKRKQFFIKFSKRSGGSIYGYDGNELCKNKLFRQPRSIKEILSKT